MERSQEIAKLSAAMAKAQGAIKAALRDTDNPFFKSRYADLASTWEACREQLSTNGISVFQSPESRSEDGHVTVSIVTLLSHESGEYIQGTLTLPVAKADAQGIGSAITYGRRYALASMVGVAPDDDDVNAAVGHGQQAQGSQKAKPQKKEDQPASKSEGTSGHKKAETPIDHLKVYLAKTYGVKTLEDCNALLANCCTPNQGGPVTMSYLESDNNAIQGVTEEIEMYCTANKINPSELLHSVKTVTA